MTDCRDMTTPAPGHQLTPQAPPQQDPSVQEGALSEDDPILMLGAEISLVCFPDPHDGQRISSSTSRTLWSTSYVFPHASQR